jgi:Lon protease-like protein
MMKFLKDYNVPSDLPETLPIFPLAGALLLPRADLPLNIFEPRYLEMMSDAMSGERMVGMIQPTEDSSNDEKPRLMKVGCAGRITSYTETPDGRMIVTLTGVSRFSVAREIKVTTPYRQVKANFKPFAVDLVMDKGASEVNRPALMAAFKDYLNANNMSADWTEINAASTEILVNTLSLLAPYPANEKQALLEAPDLKTRAEVLVALTEIALSKSFSGKKHSLQ